MAHLSDICVPVLLMTMTRRRSSDPWCRALIPSKLFYILQTTTFLVPLRWLDRGGVRARIWVSCRTAMRFWSMNAVDVGSFIDTLMCYFYTHSFRCKPIDRLAVRYIFGLELCVVESNCQRQRRAQRNRVRVGAGGSLSPVALSGQSSDLSPSPVPVPDAAVL